eukprot:COSAG06_NODE_34385_length_475_cov_1.167553_1_plen_86_part_10
MYDGMAEHACFVSETMLACVCACLCVSVSLCACAWLGGQAGDGSAQTAQRADGAHVLVEMDPLPLTFFRNGARALSFHTHTHIHTH